MNRWYYRNRPKIAVVAAFGVACLLGLVVASIGLPGLRAQPGEPQTPVTAP